MKADEVFLDKNERVDVNLLKSLIYASGNYYETGYFIAKVKESIDVIDTKPFVADGSDRYANEALMVKHNRKSVCHFTNETGSKKTDRDFAECGYGSIHSSQ